MKLSKMNAFLGTLALVGACNAPASNQGALSADATARNFGVASYVVEANGARLFDADGVELGQLVISAPDTDRRLIDLALVDGTTDEVEVYRPLNGKFWAPIAVENLTSAVAADKALAPLLAQYAIELFVRPETRLQPSSGAAPEDIANTTSCLSPSSDSPAGCARPANTSLGCTNPSQLPASVTQNDLVSDGDTTYYLRASDGGACNTYCASNGWITTEWQQDPQLGDYICGCGHRYSANKWVASCPRSTCTTVGQYDAVPRLRSCTDPGSCTKSQGTVTCTPYH